MEWSWRRSVYRSEYSWPLLNVHICTILYFSNWNVEHPQILTVTFHLNFDKYWKIHNIYAHLKIHFDWVYNFWLLKHIECYWLWRLKVSEARRTLCIHPVSVNLFLKRRNTTLIFIHTLKYTYDGCIAFYFWTSNVKHPMIPNTTFHWFFYKYYNAIL